MAHGTSLKLVTVSATTAILVRYAPSGKVLTVSDVMTSVQAARALQALVTL